MINGKHLLDSAVRFDTVGLLDITMITAEQGARERKERLMILTSSELHPQTFITTHPAAPSI